MEPRVRKLIDVELPIVRIISRKAEIRKTTFKNYVEDLIRQDALKDAGLVEPRYCVKDRELRSLVGIAKVDRESADDGRLEYILSKL